MLQEIVYRSQLTKDGDAALLLQAAVISNCSVSMPLPECPSSQLLQLVAKIRLGAPVQRTLRHQVVMKTFCAPEAVSSNNHSLTCAAPRASPQTSPFNTVIAASDVRVAVTAASVACLLPAVASLLRVCVHENCGPAFAHKLGGHPVVAIKLSGHIALLPCHLILRTH